MDTRQIALVQDSFVHVAPITEEVAAYFYERVFARAPQVRPLFKGDMAEQGQKLMLTIGAVVAALDQLDTILPVARELAIRHVGYGVQDAHYDVVGVSLLETLAFKLGPLFTPELNDAWAVAYTLIADTMKGAARRAA